MDHLLILHSSVDGHTVKICERLQAIVEADGQRVTLARIEDAAALDLALFDKIVVGASIRYGKHRPAVLDFIERQRPLLARRPSAFFSVSIVARKANRNRPENNPYLIKFLRQTRWQPDRLAVFAGKLDYPRYRFVDRQMIRLIMLMTKGPTDPASVVDFTDWQAVDEFGRELAELHR